MSIVINRITGEVTHPPIAPVQQEQLLGAIIRAYTDKHPEVFSETRTSQLEVTQYGQR